jgi:hypothetical protein
MLITILLGSKFSVGYCHVDAFKIFLWLLSSCRFETPPLVIAMPLLLKFYLVIAIPL